MALFFGSGLGSSSAGDASCAGDPLPCAHRDCFGLGKRNSRSCCLRVTCISGKLVRCLLQHAHVHHYVGALANNDRQHDFSSSSTCIFFILHGNRVRDPGHSLDFCHGGPTTTKLHGENGQFQLNQGQQGPSPCPCSTCTIF